MVILLPNRIENKINSVITGKMKISLKTILESKNMTSIVTPKKDKVN